MVVDETGDKMSKVKGNVIDPLDLDPRRRRSTTSCKKALPGAPERRGARQVQEGLSVGGADGQRLPGVRRRRAALHARDATRRRHKRIALAPKRIEGYRHFCNKIWNATRFALPLPRAAPSAAHGERAEPPRRCSNRWILVAPRGRDRRTPNAGIDEFRLDDASSALYRFFWNELCDWYLELTKPVLRGGRSKRRAEDARDARARARDRRCARCIRSCRSSPKSSGSGCRARRRAPRRSRSAPIPTAADGRRDADAEREMEIVQAVISAARTIRSEHEVHPGAKVPLVLRAADDEDSRLARRRARHHPHAGEDRRATRSSSQAEADGPPGSVMSVAGEVEVLVGLRGLVEGAKEAARIEREIKKVEKDIAALREEARLARFRRKGARRRGRPVPRAARGPRADARAPRRGTPARRRAGLGVPAVVASRTGAKLLSLGGPRLPPPSGRGGSSSEK